VAALTGKCDACGEADAHRSARDEDALVLQIVQHTCRLPGRPHDALARASSAAQMTTLAAVNRITDLWACRRFEVGALFMYA
jgi:hypothetical protein